MADKLLKSIKFPTLPDRYVIGDTSLSEEGAAAEAKAVGEALATKADTKGRYEDLIVGGAEQLMSDEYETDKEPYLFRSTGGSADVGNREYVDKIVGGTVAWNQLAIATGYNTETINGITFTKNDDGTWAINGTATANAIKGIGYTAPNMISGHKYMVGSSAWKAAGYGVAANSYYANRDAPYWMYNIPINIVAYVTEGTTVNNVVLKPQLFDLTAMFGTTIADYIYSLEQSQAGAGVAWFRNYFPKDYYAYDAGTLRSVEGVSAHETVGFNQWDEEWVNGYYNRYGMFTAASGYVASNKIKLLPDTAYFISSQSGELGRVCLYDGNENFTRTFSGFDPSTQYAFRTSSKECYVVFDTKSAYGAVYKNDICINLSDPSRNGEYEPYTKHSYPLDSSLTLRGVPKLVDGKLAYDGDVYPPSGEVQRRYGLRAYQSGDESLTDAITDGTNTVYKLTTPTTETADVYEQYQKCDPSGTEEFVTTGIVPVGHETRYPHDLKKKIETAPDSPSTDGTYLMKRSGGKNTYMALPSTPSANGSYVLTVTVSGGSASYSWAAKE